MYLFIEELFPQRLVNTVMTFVTVYHNWNDNRREGDKQNFKNLLEIQSDSKNKKNTICHFDFIVLGENIILIWLCKKFKKKMGVCKMV